MYDFEQAYREQHGPTTYANPKLAKYIHTKHPFVNKHGGRDHLAFSTNLEWINLHDYRRVDIQDYLQAIVDSHHVFTDRWGDAPIRFSLAYLFWNASQVMKVCTSYYHSMWPYSPKRGCHWWGKPYRIEHSVLETLQSMPHEGTFRWD